MNLNNIISTVLVLTAVLSGLGLTIRKKERDERPEAHDLDGMTDGPSKTIQRRPPP